MQNRRNEVMLIDPGLLESLINRIIELDSCCNSSKWSTAIYSNKQVQELLHINDKLIRKYREQGLIGYTKVGDKYWYTRKDVESFLRNSHHQAFA